MVRIYLVFHSQLVKIAKEEKIRRIVVYKETEGWVPCFEIEYRNGEIVTHTERPQKVDDVRTWKSIDRLLPWLALNFNVTNVEIDMEGIAYDKDHNKDP